MGLNSKICMLLIFTLSYCSAFRSDEITLKELKLSISFNDYFINDTISLYVNDCLIFKNKVVSSDQILGYTGITIDISRNGSYTTRGKIIELHCKTNISDLNNLRIHFNGLKKIYVIDLRKGKFIGFDKHEEDLQLYQLNLPFEYM
jgi:hypothetical protein